MAYYLSEQWANALHAVELLRHEAIELTSWEFDANVPCDHEIASEVWGASQQIIDTADGQTSLDLTAVAQLEHQLNLWRPGQRRREPDAAPAIAEVQATLERCVPVFDRLRRMGTSESEPKSGQADSKTDNGKKSWEKTPDNPDVLRLAKLIRNDPDAKRSKIDIAREYANGDEKKAQSLLRQIRRSPHLLNSGQADK